MSDITIGFVPTLDCAPLVMALGKGFASDEGLVLRLERETAWSHVRDRVAVGQCDGAHMPAPLVLASNLGLYPLACDLVVPICLNLGGGAMTVSKSLYHALRLEGLDLYQLQPLQAGRALRRVCQRRRPPERLRLAIAHEHSSLGYHLRYWLAASGLKPDQDFDIVVLPSSLMADGLAREQIDGFFAAEPWNSLAVDRDLGRIITTSSLIWKAAPDKVVGFSLPWIDRHPATLNRFLRALYRAAQWCDNPENTGEVAQIMAGPRYLGVDSRLLLPPLTGQIGFAPGCVAGLTDFLLFDRKAAGFPWQSHGLWFYSQMVRWGICERLAEHRLRAMATYRPDLYRRALKPMFAPVPGANLKVEGALTGPHFVGSTRGRLVLGPDDFFDGQCFDPDRLEDALVPEF